MANLKELRGTRGNCVKIGMDTYELASDAWLTLCRYFDLPHDLLPQLGRSLGEFVLRCLNAGGRRARGAPEEVRFSYDDKGRILTLTPSHLMYVSNPEIVRVIEETIPADITSETLSARLSLTETAFDLDLYTEQSRIEPREGDILYGGVSVRHSQAGSFPTIVLGYIHRLVCKNGMTQRVCLAGKPARTKRSKAENAKEPVLNAIREQINGAFAQLQDRLDGIKQLTEHRLDVDELPEGLRRRWSINKEVAAEISKALHNDEFSRTYTEYDLVNALSRVETHSDQLAPRYQRYLSMAAGMFAQRHVHQCPQCGTWLSAD